MLKIQLPAQTRTGSYWGKAVLFWVNQLGMGVLSLLLAKAALMGELYPFGTSFLAAVCVNRPGLRRPALVGGLAGIALSTGGWVLVSYILCMVLLYLIFLKSQKNEYHWLIVPAMVAAIQLLVRGSAVFFTTNELYQWIGLAFECFFAGVLTLVALTGLEAYTRVFRGEILTPEEKTSLGLIALGALVGIAEAEYVGVGIQSVLSRWLVLWGAFLGGPGGGAAVGAAVGLVPSIQGTLTTGPVAIYALAGLSGGVFNNFRKVGVVIGFTLAILFLTLFYSEQMVIEQAFRETLIAMAAFLLFNIPGLPTVKTRITPDMGLLEREKNLNIADKLKKMAQVFYELGKTFRTEAKPVENNGDLSELFSKVAARVCEGCSLHRICWEQDFYKTYRCLLEATTVLEAAGTISDKDFGANLKRRCMRLRELGMALNAEMDNLRLVNSYEKQLASCRELVNNQLVNLAKVVNECSEEFKEEAYSRNRGPEYIRKKLEEKGIKLNDLVFMDLANGEKGIITSFSGCSDKKWCQTMVAPNLSQIMGKNYRIKSMDCTQGEGECSCRFVPGKAYQVKVGKAQCAKEGQKISGDVCNSFALADQRFVLVMSDGMGTGKEAHRESSAAAKLVEKLLMAGFSPEMVIKTINTVLFLRSGKENFVTLDLILVNQINGFSDFIKIGGAPSLICSAKGLKVVQALAPPAGILDSIEMQTFRHLLIPGSVVIMMSDGVWEAINSAGGPAGWFEDVLTRINMENPQKIADTLLYLARKASDNKAKDDMCIQVARLETEEIA